MLDRPKLLRALQQQADKLFLDTTLGHTVARDSWHRILADESFAQKARISQSPWFIPLWQQQLGQMHTISPCSSYTVVAVDGSQIYPDKHQGTVCSLINVGTITISYGDEKAEFKAHSEPHVYASDESDDLASTGAVDMINCRRQEHELLAGYERCTEFIKHSYNHPLVLLTDGSLIFWHLESKSPDVKYLFLSSYLALLQRLYEARIIIGGYISLPKSKDLINLIRLELCNFQPDKADTYKMVDNLVDPTIAHFVLEPGTRSIVFQSTSPITTYYPEHLRPHFLYMHVDTEIARVEIPAWIARDNNLVEQLTSVIYDQTRKGRGYPVALAEAHEQAVVKGPDRDLFYHLVHKMGIEQHKHVMPSPKALKKRGIGI